MATDFHAAYRQSILDFATEVGLAGVETDGQYENAACADDTGDHHHNGLGGSYDAQLANIQAFNAKMKAQGIYQTGAGECACLPCWTCLSRGHHHRCVFACQQGCVRVTSSHGWMSLRSPLRSNVVQTRTGCLE